MKPYEIIGRFELLKHEVQKILYEWLETTLPNLDRREEWNQYVVNRLTNMQRGIISELNLNSNKLKDLDFAMLLSVVLGNWSYLQNKVAFTNENKSQFIQMRLSRNRWSHLTTIDIEHYSPLGIDLEDVIIDITVMNKLIREIKNDHPVINAIDSFRQDLINFTHTTTDQSTPPIQPNRTPIQTLPDNERENQIKIAYVMSRFDYHIINDIRGVMQNQTQTFAYLSEIVNVKVNTLKNNRDAFDPHVEQENSNRKGWWQKKITPEFKAIKENYDDKKYDVIKKEIEKILQ